MPETLEDFKSIKGKLVKLYSGNKRNANVDVRFKLNGANRDISGTGEDWGDIKGIIKKPGTPDANANVALFAVTKTTPAEGLVTLPFSTLEFLSTGEGLVLVIWEVHDTDKKKIRAKFKCDILGSDLD
ncbi:unnamed protein product [marine sediment metagenome]|uniref:Uncharacterized protein n=1 Tax=marine sediment metagenome TaxID=412755 RepID=X0WGG3_9ZZZZ